MNISGSNRTFRHCYVSYIPIIYRLLDGLKFIHIAGFSVKKPIVNENLSATGLKCFQIWNTNMIRHRHWFMPQQILSVAVVMEISLLLRKIIVNWHVTLLPVVID